MKNQFEQHIKQSLEGFEAEYNPADWSDMANRLSQAKATKYSGLGKGLMIAASVIATAGIIYYFNAPEAVNTITPVNSATKEHIIIMASDVNENPVDQAESKEKEQVIHDQAAVSNNTSEKEKTSDSKATQENKEILTVNAETQAVNNNIENKAPVQEPEQAVSGIVAPNALALSAAFHTDVTRICEGTPVQFVAEKNDALYTYKWTFGDGETSAEQSPKHIFSEAGIYAVKLRIVSKDKKQAEQKNSITVVAAPSVQMNFTSSEDNNLLLNFEADGDKVVDWKWDFGDKQTSSVQSPAHTYRKNGNYKVAVVAKNSTGCSTVVVREVNLKPDLFAPTGFTPDGDGRNDTWMPVALLNGDYKFTITVTDNAGKVVFKTSDRNNTWDGANAKPGDTFIWHAIVKDKTGDEISYKGLITISE